MATTVKIDDDLKGRIRDLAEARQRSPHWIMRKAIEDYVEKEEKREAFKKDALKAWNEYQENGLHTTAEETHEWLARLVSGDKNKKPPKCHK